MPPRSMNTISQKCADVEDFLNKVNDMAKNSILTAMPAEVVDFDPASQTITAQPLITQKIRDKRGTITDTQLPQVLDVPVVFPRGGGYSLTFPIQQGDECLLIFASLDFSAWWANGGISNQEHLIKHNIGSAFALLGVGNEKRAIENYSPTFVELRDDSGNNKISLQGSNMSLQCNGKLSINAGSLEIITSSNDVKIDSKTWSTHAHSNGNAGANTGGIV